ncbi:hypothetical protein AURDEDRAFT_155927 [Auricularia subglabra TFB-10046 SS5]|nr:hypothetical protein AURDEDRAFT_155927 [Auricularia subglabra TFB-10046 SS5]
MRLDRAYVVTGICALLSTFVIAEQSVLEQPPNLVEGSGTPPECATPKVVDGRQHELSLTCTNAYDACCTSCTGARTRIITQYCLERCQSEHCTATCTECGMEVSGWTLQQMIQFTGTISPGEQPSEHYYRGCLRRCIGVEKPDKQLSLVTAMHDDLTRLFSWDVVSSVAKVYGCQLYCTLSSVL